MIGRREAMIGTVVGIGALVARPAEACSLTFDPHLRFSEDACHAALQAWIDLLNAGAAMPIEQITHLADNMSVAINDEEMIDAAVGEHEGVDTETDRVYLFYKNFRLSGGRADPRPIQIVGTHLIRRLRNRASYQFTLERYSYVPAEEVDGGSCGPSSSEGYETFRTSYIATFWNNRLRTVKQFPEWYLEERG